MHPGRDAVLPGRRHLDHHRERRAQQHPEEILEAASLDGANAWQTAWRVKLPMIRPWIGYAALHEPRVRLPAVPRAVPARPGLTGSVAAEWTPTQLGYAFAFTNRNFPAAAAMSIILLVITLAIGLFIVFRSGLFGDEKESTLSAVTEIPVDRPVVDHPVGRRRWSAGRIARVSVMLVVAAMFVFPIVGFIAMAFRNRRCRRRQRRLARARRACPGTTSLQLEPDHRASVQRRRSLPAWLLNSLHRRRPAAGCSPSSRRCPPATRSPGCGSGSAQVLLFATLLAMVMPNTVLVIPLFLEVNAVGAVGSSGRSP